jgi:DNA-binding MarR family transcriptional regulator
MTRQPDRFKGLSGFRYALRRFLAASEEISRRAGVTQQQYQVLLAIKASDGGEVAMKDLAEELLLTSHAAVQMVDRLEKASLAERRPSTLDRRVVLVGLTPKGATLVKMLADQHLDEMLRQEPRLRRSLNDLRRLASDK